MEKPYSKLRGKIWQIYGNIKKFALSMGISEATILSKMNGKSSFTEKEILKVCKILEIPKEEITEYFFS